MKLLIELLDASARLLDHGLAGPAVQLVAWAAGVWWGQG